MVKSLAFVSGKGGVGKTSLAVNSAINLALMGFKVAVLDTDFGLSNANIMMGVKTENTISEFLSGSCMFEDVIYNSHGGVKLIPGGSGTLDTLNLDTEQRWKIIRSLDVLENEYYSQQYLHHHNLKKIVESNLRNPAIIDVLFP